MSREIPSFLKVAAPQQAPAPTPTPATAPAAGAPQKGYFEQAVDWGKQKVQDVADWTTGKAKGLVNTGVGMVLDQASETLKSPEVQPVLKNIVNTVMDPVNKKIEEGISSGAQKLITQNMPAIGGTMLLSSALGPALGSAFSRGNSAVSGGAAQNSLLKAPPSLGAFSKSTAAPKFFSQPGSAGEKGSGLFSIFGG